ncbi:META domain-containing protein [Leisingera sp. F5]|uniref:META domain-containing protein n=1 Tax=Leisingera sp. F5 TaxID=1813816 RepID=UPI000A43BFE4|nr:META domain-containing protein [Leisingera sp. F5]
MTLAVFAGLCGGGLAVYSFASDTVTGNSGEISMASTSAESFDGAWIVQKVQDVDLTQFEELRFDFDGGTLYGSSPCRSFTTTFGPDLRNIMFSPFEIGGGLCDETAMIAERDFLQQVGLVNRMELTGDGQLVMYNFEKPLLWAKRLAG